MRVRVVQRPNGREWMVETKLNWFTVWVRETIFYDDTAREKAIAYAKLLANPEIIEVTK